MKNKTKRNFRRASIVFLVFAVIAVAFTFNIFDVFSQEYGEGDYCLHVDFNPFENGFSMENIHSVTVNDDPWSSSDDLYNASPVDGNLWTIKIVAGMNGDYYPDISFPGGSLIENPDDPNDNGYILYTAIPNPDNTDAPDDDYLLTIVIKDTWTGKGDKTQQVGQCGFWGITIKEGPPITNQVHNVTSNVTINIIGSELEYHYVENSDDADVTYFKFDINGGTGEGQGDENLVPFRFNNAEYHYNDNEPPKNVDSVNTINPIEYTYRYDDTGYVEFCVNGGGTDEYTSIKINNVEYAEYAPHTQNDYWEHYDGYAQMFCIPNVPYSESYHVEVHGEQTSDDNKIPGFGWSYLSADRSEGVSPEEEGNFAHGYLEFVSASITIDNEDLVFNSVSAFNNYRYHNSEHGSILHFASGNKEYPEENRRLAWGEAHMPFGTTLRVRIVPDEGYQLTGLTVSANGFHATETPGEYELTLNRTNLSYNDDLNQFDLNPRFERIDGQVVATATNVAQGEITISGGQDAFATGTPKLEVTDVASMSPQRLDGFNEAAEDQGYTIDNYLEISLYSTIYKGGKKDENNNYLSWDTEVNTLANDAKATVVLQLEDEVAEAINGKEVIIVHEEHDGERVVGYDLIEANYDSQNKTISFETGSFSTFAIAVRGEGNQEQDPGEQPPETVTVEFNSNGGSEVPSVTIDKGTKVERPEGVTNGNLTLEGWYTDEGLHDRFDFNTPIDNDITLYAKWVETLETYEVPDGNGNLLVFEREEGHEYILTIVDFLSYSKEEVMALGEIDSDTYDAIFGGLKKSVKSAGELLAFYNIELEEDGHGAGGDGITIKILITDKMKKYNTFKLFYVNDDFQVEGDPIILQKQGNYLVGTLEHLSLYALAGSTSTSISTAPQTGDNIFTWVALLTISTLGLLVGGFTVIKSKKAKTM